MVSVIGIVLTPFQECSRPPIRIMAMLLAPGGAGTILSVTKAFVKPIMKMTAIVNFYNTGVAVLPVTPVLYLFRLYAVYWEKGMKLILTVLSSRFCSVVSPTSVSTLSRASGAHSEFLV